MTGTRTGARLLEALVHAATTAHGDDRRDDLDELAERGGHGFGTNGIGRH